MEKAKRYRATSRLVLVLIALLSGIAAVVMYSFYKSESWAWAAVASLVVVSVGTLIAYGIVFVRGAALRTGNVRHGVTSMVRPQDIDELFDNGSGTLGNAQAALFVNALISPRTTYARITEHLELYHRSTKIRSTYTIRIPSAHVGTDVDFIVPLYVPARRSELQNGLRVFDGGGKRVSTIDSGRQVAFAAAVMRRVLHATGAAAYKQYVDVIEPKVLAILASHRAPSPVRVSAIVEAISLLPRAKGTEHRISTTISLFRVLARVQSISVLVPAEAVTKTQWPHLHRFTVERREVSVLGNGPEVRAPRLVSLGDFAKQALNVRPNRMYYLISAAMRTHSYHLEMEGPEGTYLSEMEVLPRAGTIDAQMAPRLGQRRSHLYTTRVSAPFYVAAAFNERGPGSFASTTLTALAASLIVLLLSWQEHDNLGVAPDDQVVQAWLIPALLAVPLAVATLSGWEAVKTSKHPTLLSRSINLLVIFLVLAAFICEARRNSLGDWADPLWTLLPLFGAVLTIISLISWTLRLKVEHNFNRGIDRK